MPYIKQNLRDGIDSGECVPADAGQLNYAITSLLRKYENFNGTKYQTFNDMIGALEGAKLELYRRGVAPYEEIKILENGDV